MKEFRNIINEYRKIDFEQKQAALATVVKVRGSSYRSPGARMLITNDGRWVGSISGGCLEGDALRKARQVMMSGEPRLVTYDTTENGNSLGVGLGCNGVIDVLIEPIDPAKSDHPITRLQQFVNCENLTVMATVFRSEGQRKVDVADQFWLDHKGMIHGSISDPGLKQQIHQDLLSVRGNLKPAIKYYDGECVEVFFEIIEPVIDLLIFGGGFDAKPVVEIAKMMGWDVTVIDECIAHVAPVNFPSADNVMFCKRENVSEKVKVKPYSAAVLMSHSYEYDLQVLKRILPTSLNYIGILGPKKRTEKMFAEMEGEGIRLSTDDKYRIHSPVGLDIGAETPEEIALSIITEIQAKFTNRSGGFLKYRNAPIHQRDGKDDQVFRQVYINQEDSRAGSG
ncbi:Xanthine and CO dehydrogenases maturation factor, XdhC/CoxF family [Fulvivirga imtechensis AK7]|uniref:Xanthine and CO dehydrogenases maturation factor, XdhC/CoxF family n=1 Tax=Fulvivirga imtechensis AK7 TaxID=1237149 RepID=L8JHJ1_9BACT|nr:XdhC/CoxI family protein [Fulvivirga imtechensis]ELR68311.1 Xanthine and CO dehydrogenases maturation factor, XdhC/CoxF family [Fulvivirga imtechensis AK7]